ncbi:MAG: hypothetical protein AAB656_01990 [Patescibacteria group bacterium]
MERKNISKILHETIGWGISELRGRAAQADLEKLAVGEYFVSQRPVYVSQLANADKRSISGFYGNISDEKAARKFGASNNKIFSYWSWRSCGIVDIQMILKTLYGPKFKSTTMDLVGEGLKLGGYNIDKDEGWYHKSISELAKSRGLFSRTDKFVPSVEIATNILKDQFVLASVKSAMGHLLLVYGFRVGKKGKLEGFWVHDPNPFYENGEGKFIEKEVFDTIFSRRVIIVGRKDEDG